MTATMTSMEWRIVDTLAAYQLEAGDYIRGAEGEIVELIQINDHPDKIVIVYSDDYGDVYSEEHHAHDLVNIYLLFDTD